MSQAKRQTRMTAQRRIVLAAVQKMDTHPTVDEVFARVRRRLPRISLATVYRNLEVLAEQGLVRKLDAGPPRRFDCTLREHYHIRCVRCGRVDDVPVEPFAKLEYDLHHQSNYRVLGHHLEFFGICPACRGKHRNNRKAGQKTSGILTGRGRGPKLKSNSETKEE